MFVTDEIIIKTFFRNSHGICYCAGVLGISKVRVCKVIFAYKRKKGIR